MSGEIYCSHLSHCYYIFTLCTSIGRFDRHDSARCPLELIRLDNRKRPTRTKYIKMLLMICTFPPHPLESSCFLDDYNLLDPWLEVSAPDAYLRWMAFWSFFQAKRARTSFWFFIYCSSTIWFVCGSILEEK